MPPRRVVRHPSQRTRWVGVAVSLRQRNALPVKLRSVSAPNYWMQGVEPHRLSWRPVGLSQAATVVA